MKGVQTENEARALRVRAALANTAVRVANPSKKARVGGDAGMQSIFWDAKCGLSVKKFMNMHDFNLWLL